MRLILDTDHTVPTKDLYLRLKWLPLTLKLQLNRLVLVFKAIKKVAPDNVNALFNLYCPTRNLRSADQHLLEIPRAKTEFFKKSFTVRGAKDFNNLPVHLRKIDAVDVFKRDCYNFLFTKYVDESF